jgi:HD-GYP domain-containing protein (c-di-GMP phosphodiesterase class II)
MRRASARHRKNLHPEHILTKRSRLTQEEYDVMKQHVEMSITIIKHLPSSIM